MQRFETRENWLQPAIVAPGMDTTASNHGLFSKKIPG
jgi:hypothetical protein